METNITVLGTPVAIRWLDQFNYSWIFCLLTLIYIAIKSRKLPIHIYLLCGLTVFGLIFIVALIHEFFHAFAARLVGVSTERIVVAGNKTFAYYGPEYEQMTASAALIVFGSGPLLNLLTIGGLTWLLKKYNYWQYFLIRSLIYVLIYISITTILPLPQNDGAYVIFSLTYWLTGNSQFATTFTNGVTSWAVIYVYGALAILIITFLVKEFNIQKLFFGAQKVNRSLKMRRKF